MALKDYKSQSTATPPKSEKKAKAKSRFKRTVTIFIGGYLLGALSGGFLISYLDNDHTANSVLQTEQPSAKPSADAGQTQATQTAISEQQTIDYQFYEQLEKFEFLNPAQDPPTDDKTDQPLLWNKTGKVAAPSPDFNDKNEPSDKTSTRYILQAGTFSDAQAAQTQRRRIIDLGYQETHIFQLAHDDKQYYRVWLGPYADLSQATVVGNALKSAYIEVMLRHNLRKFDRREK